MTTPEPKPVLSDFDRMFEEQFPKADPAHHHVEREGSRPADQSTRYPKARQA